MRRLLRPAMAVGVAALVTRVDPVLGVVVLLAGWAWTSWVLPARALVAVTGYRLLPDRALFGEEIVVEVGVEASRRVPWLALTDALPFDLGPNTRWVTSLDSWEKRSHMIRFEATKRGLHRVGPAVAATGDGFGLRRVQRTLVPPQPLLVYPRIVPLDTLAIAAGAPLPLIPTRTPLYEDPTRVVGVRDYRTGDPFKRIHWTASAGAGALLVKKLHPGIARDVVLAVDLSRDSHPIPGRRRSAEIAVTTAASIAHHLATATRESVGVRIVGRDAPTGEDTMVDVAPGRDSPRLARILEHLARADLSSAASIDALLDPSGFPFGASVILLTGVPDRRHVADCLRLRQLGLSVSVILTAGDRHRTGWERAFTEHGLGVRSVANLAELVAL